ncbi:MAG: glycosyltransferase [Verrucomicrobia bacterium]|jgi:glycosyltransferase involved in cell wall biosynthesis/FMN phosphatase YigB (HAD superfamily)|nr:glycosyltransferase [Verrucomicrobiota bacterium]
MKFLFDLSDSCHSRQQSGIPRLARNLQAAFKGDKEIVLYDRYWRRWRRADERERRWADPSHHVAGEADKVRGWTAWQKARGRLGRRLPLWASPFTGRTALVVPELYFPSEGRNFAALRSRCGGPLVAIFHDAIALRYPQWSSTEIARNFPAYAEDLLHFDGVAAVSASSARELREFWAARGWRNPPPVAVITPGSDALPAEKASTGEGSDPPLILMVSTVEARKNHLGVLAAAGELWEAGHRFRLVFVGGCVPEMRAEWEEALAAAGAPEGCCEYRGRVPRAELEQLYRDCLFTVYPSFWEGYGLPVMESLQHGKPCLCSERGGLVERAAGGGCLIADPEDPGDLARAWRRLLMEADLRARLRGEARARRFRSWSEYADDLKEWTGDLPVRRKGALSSKQGGVADFHDEKAFRRLLRREIGELRERLDSIHAAYARFAEDAAIPDPPSPFAVPERTDALEEGTFPEVDLSQVDVLSMDIFDTCLRRIVPMPSSVFRMAAKREGADAARAEGFAELRRATEEEVRHAAQADGRAEDIGLAEIYTALAGKLGWSGEELARRRACEVELELALVRARPEALRLVNAARERGCRIVYVSEMYLPETVLRTMLEGAGLPVDEDSVFASGTRGRSKGSGRLYELVRGKFPGKRLLHIGDNRASDGTAAASAGIPSRLVKPPTVVYKEELSGLLHRLAEEEKGEGDFWERCGASVLGPLVAAWTLWLERRVREERLDELFFLTRDGYFPRIAWERLGLARRTGIAGRTLFGSRKLYRLAAMESIGAEDWDFLLKPAPRMTGCEFLTRAGIPREAALEACGRVGLDPEAPLCHHRGFYDPRSRDLLYHAFTAVIPLFYDYRDGLRERVLAYLADEGLHPAERRGAVVDVGWNGSSLRDLRRLCEATNPFAGLFFALWQAAGQPHGAFSFFVDGPQAEGEEHLLRGGVALLELFLGSPCGSVVDLRKTETGWEPVYQEPDILGSRERAAYAGMERGFLRFLDRFHAAGGPFAGGHGKAFLRGELSRLLFHPSAEEVRELGAASHAEGWGSSRRFRLLPRAGWLEGHGQRLAAFAYAGWKAPLRRTGEFGLFVGESGP